MQRIKHQPVRNKIDLTDAGQVRAWTKRFHITADGLKAIVDKVGCSVATVTKELELQRSGLRPPGPAGAETKAELPPVGTARLHRIMALD
jgi:hypothetical protein